MDSTIAQAAVRDLHRRSENRARMAKAGTRKTETAQFFSELGACIEEVRRGRGLSLEEFAHALKRDDRQVAKWISGDERPQLETVLAVETFRAPLLIALSRLCADIEIVTELRVRRLA